MPCAATLPPFAERLSNSALRAASDFDADADFDDADATENGS